MTPEESTEILGVRISRLGMDGALKRCREALAQGSGGYVCFANVHSVIESRSEEALRSSLNRSFLTVADGVPLLWVSRRQGTPIVSRVCGPDFMSDFIRQTPDIQHGFMGGAPGRAEEIGRRFAVKNAIYYSSPMRPFAQVFVKEDLEKLQALGGGHLPRTVWVGLGAPKQELWMACASEYAPDTLFFGVGAAFDFLSGAKRRAPIWMQRSGLEWLYRLFQEPRRLWKRYLYTNGIFLALVVRSWFNR